LLRKLCGRAGLGVWCYALLVSWRKDATQKLLTTFSGIISLRLDQINELESEHENQTALPSQYVSFPLFLPDHP